MIRLHLLITDYRPEEMRVVERGKRCFSVESKRRDRTNWVEQKAWGNLEDAILDCVNWYPNPGSELQSQRK